MAQLILRNVCKRYQNKKKSAQEYAVHDFSLECKDGEFKYSFISLSISDPTENGVW